jgi:hypothetical protein
LFVCIDPCQKRQRQTSKLFRGIGLSADHKKRAAALMLLEQGKATLSETARLAGVSRQRMSNWAKRLDVQEARDRWLGREWNRLIKKLGGSS